jgi:hypothetical protein
MQARKRSFDKCVRLSFVLQNEGKTSRKKERKKNKLLKRNSVQMKIT